MLRSRIIPCLLIHEDGLNKTVKFKPAKYVGDPLNAVKIFNEKEVDELIILDIDKTVKNEPINFEAIQSLANECRMPLCYGGGVKTVSDAVQIIKMGVEKVALSSAALSDLNLCNQIAAIIGKQSVVVVLDVKKNIFNKDYSVFTHNGTVKVSSRLSELLKIISSYDIGEVVLNSIDLDGTMKGYDIALSDLATSLLRVPVTMLGGASSVGNIQELISRHKIIGAAAGSIFVFKGRLKAVLISYPNRTERLTLYS
jgi:imidazole glycerol-phosphate synthase subunit HisF